MWAADCLIVVEQFSMGVVVCSRSTNSLLYLQPSGCSLFWLTANPATQTAPGGVCVLIVWMKCLLTFLWRKYNCYKYSVITAPLFFPPVFLYLKIPFLDLSFCLSLPFFLIFHLCSQVDLAIPVLAQVKVFTPVPSILDTIRYVDELNSSHCMCTCYNCINVLRFFRIKTLRTTLCLCPCLHFGFRWQAIQALTHSPLCLAPCTHLRRQCWTPTTHTHTPATMSTPIRTHSSFPSLTDRIWRCGALWWR